MKHLDHATPRAWVELVAKRTVDLLCDHAHCELRAEASALALAAKHGAACPGLADELRAVAAEEREHFEAVLELLRERDVELPPARPNPYASALLAARSHRHGEILLDRLLISSLIEARSLERFHLLAEHLEDRALAAFYRSFVPAEAAHRALFVELARRSYPRERVAERLAELRAAEGRIVRGLAFAYRMHSGLADAEVSA